VPGPGVRLTAQLKCVYTNACSMGNKQEELEATVQQDGYDLVAITEMWWDNLHDWHAVMDGYRLSLGKTGQQGEVVELLYM